MKTNKYTIFLVKSRVSVLVYPLKYTHKPASTPFVLVAPLKYTNPHKH